MLSAVHACQVGCTKIPTGLKKDGDCRMSVLLNATIRGEGIRCIHTINFSVYRSIY